MVKTHGVLLSAVIKMIRHFEKLRVASKTTPQAVANLLPTFWIFIAILYFIIAQSSQESILLSHNSLTLLSKTIKFTA